MKDALDTINELQRAANVCHIGYDILQPCYVVADEKQANDMMATCRPMSLFTPGQIATAYAVREEERRAKIAIHELSGMPAP